MELYVLILVFLLILSAFFSSAETAFLSLDRVQIEHHRQESGINTRRVSRLIANPRKLLSSILLGNNLVNAGAAAVATAIAAQLMSSGTDIVVATICVTILLVIFGELGPKTFALDHNFRLAQIYASPLVIWTMLTRPIIMVLDRVSDYLLKLTGDKPNLQRVLSLGELRTAIRMGSDSGAIGVTESNMLLGALRLQERQIRHIMTARVDMVLTEASEPLIKLGTRLATSGFLRLPVYSDSPDNIIGLIHVSDINTAFLNGNNNLLARNLMREPIFESERAPIARVLDEMRTSGNHLVILTDEFGATAGLVTLEDIVEEITGEILSESGPWDGNLDFKIGARLYIEGRLPIGDLSQDFGRDIDQAGAETVAGLILAHLRHIPKQGESIEVSGLRFTVVASDNRRIGLVAVENIVPLATENPEAIPK